MSRDGNMHPNSLKNLRPFTKEGAREGQRERTYRPAPSGKKNAVKHICIASLVSSSPWLSRH